MKPLSKENKKKLTMIALSLFSLVIISTGTYALWDLGEGLFTNENTITSGQAIMSYSETNEITLNNALPMKDVDGKAQNKYFDFSVSTYIKTNKNDNARISNYDILLEKLSPSFNTTSLNDNQVKVYLTKINEDGNEITLLEPTTIDKLNDYLLLHESKEFKLGKERVVTNYRLRTWIDFDVDVSNWNGSTRYSYNFRININGQTTTDDTRVLDASLNPRGVIPEGAVYYSGVTNIDLATLTVTANKTYLPGERFPEIQTGDVYIAGDYGYAYNIAPDLTPDITMNGWQVLSLDRTKSEYGAILESINGKEIISLANTFYGCVNLVTAPAIPSSVTNMQDTFSGCTSLVNAPAIPSSVTNMQGTFDSCTSLENAPTIPSSVTNMQGTFFGCTSLVNAPDMSNASSVTSMQGTFADCTNLVTAPTIPSSVTNMQGTFSGCTSLVNAPTIPSSVTNMQETFLGCTSLVNAPAIPSSVTNMTNTFYGCILLMDILNPKVAVPTGGIYYSGVTSIDKTTGKVTANKTYDEGDALPAMQIGDVYVYGDYLYGYNIEFSYSSSNLFDYSLNNEINGWGVRVLDIEKSEYGTILESINEREIISLQYTFAGCGSLVNAPVIPSSVTNMNEAFRQCGSLVNAPVIPSSVTSMDRTFQYCTSLVNAPVIPNSVTDMSSTFENCRSLVNAPAIPSNVINMVSTFSGCTSLTGNVEVNANPTWYGDAFYDTTKPIYITGSSSLATKKALAETANNGNVSY